MALDSNSKQRIPELFQEIMRVDDEIDATISSGLSSQDKWIKVLQLKKRKRELRKAAEVALQWNHNKGNSGNG